MAYCALADLQVFLDTATLVDLTDGTSPTPTTSVITGVIKAADSVIDAKLGLRYDVPFTTVPEVVKTISCALAIYELYGRHHDRSAPEAVKTRYDNATGLLNSIANGEAGLGVTVSPSSLGPSILYTKPYDENKFDMDSLEPLNDGDPDFMEATDDDA